ncbi:uncharacterized protein LOC142588508 [Dermacentor variabilis]|uniref:uncharacterized protein LOC142588508 n=1 Tax=Dermacentor variabilis TaxID=34621 RepID=UPI003F5BEB3D
MDENAATYSLGRGCLHQNRHRCKCCYLYPRLMVSSSRSLCIKVLPLILCVSGRMSSLGAYLMGTQRHSSACMCGRPRRPDATDPSSCMAGWALSYRTVCSANLRFDTRPTPECHHYPWHLFEAVVTIFHLNDCKLVIKSESTYV